jgi:hypothetical protein
MARNVEKPQVKYDSDVPMKVSLSPQKEEDVDPKSLRLI